MANKRINQLPDYTLPLDTETAYLVVDEFDGTNYKTVRIPINIFKVSLKYVNLPEFADNAAAISGGLEEDQIYKTATGELRIVI